LVDTFLRYAQNFFEKRQAATCRFSNEFRENFRNVPTKRKKGIKIQKRMHYLSSKEFCKFKNIWYQAAKKYKISIISKEEFKMNC
jgi:hypothetical protein